MHLWCENQQACAEKHPEGRNQVPKAPFECSKELGWWLSAVSAARYPETGREICVPGGFSFPPLLSKASHGAASAHTPHVVLPHHVYTALVKRGESSPAGKPQTEQPGASS